MAPLAKHSNASRYFTGISHHRQPHSRSYIAARTPGNGASDAEAVDQLRAPPGSRRRRRIAKHSQYCANSAAVSRRNATRRCCPLQKMEDHRPARLPSCPESPPLRDHRGPRTRLQADRSRCRCWCASSRCHCTGHYPAQFERKQTLARTPEQLHQAQGLSLSFGLSSMRFVPRAKIADGGLTHRLKSLSAAPFGTRYGRIGSSGEASCLRAGVRRSVKVRRSGQEPVPPGGDSRSGTGFDLD